MYGFWFQKKSVQLKTLLFEVTPMYLRDLFLKKICICKAFGQNPCISSNLVSNQKPCISSDLKIQLKIIYLQGPHSSRPCISRPSCIKKCAEFHLANLRALHKFWSISWSILMEFQSSIRFTLRGKT